MCLRLILLFNSCKKWLHSQTNFSWECCAAGCQRWVLCDTMWQRVKQGTQDNWACFRMWPIPWGRIGRVLHCCLLSTEHNVRLECCCYQGFDLYVVHSSSYGVCLNCFYRNCFLTPKTLSTVDIPDTWKFSKIQLQDHEKSTDNHCKLLFMYII